MYTIRRVCFLSITTRLYRYIYNFSLLLGVLQLHAVVNELYSFALVYVKIWRRVLLSRGRPSIPMLNRMIKTPQTIVAKYYLVPLSTSKLDRHNSTPFL